MLAPSLTALTAAFAAWLLLSGCPQDAGGTGGPAAGSGGHGAGHGAGSGGSSGSGGKYPGIAGVGGASPIDAGVNDCNGNAIPAICKLCADNTCGKPQCAGGKFLGFVCANDSDAGPEMDAGAGGGGVCNLLCVQGYHCEANHTPKCVPDSPDAGSLQWVQSCGQPICHGDNTPYDDPTIPNCTTEMLGQRCTTEGARCDGVLSCGATYLCAAEAPTNCPISRARFKQDIRYLNDDERARFHDQITQLRLATYRYKWAADVPQLGFMIDDVEPSVAVSGDQVNLYGYLSMAVAAIQVQDQRIEALERELAALSSRASKQPNALKHAPSGVDISKAKQNARSGR